MEAAVAESSRTIPSPTRLRENYARRENRLTLYFGFVLTSGLLVWLWLIASGFVAAHLWLVGGVLLALLLPLCFHLLLLISMYGRRIAIDDASDEDLGPYSKELLHQIIDDVRPLHTQVRSVRVQPEVFILRPGLGGRCNAMSIRSLFLRFVPAFNVIYVSRDLLDILRPDELRAVLAHELAHFHELNNLPGRAFIATHLVVAAFILAAIAVCPWLAAAGVLIKAPFVVVAGHLLRRAVIQPHNRLHRDAELLADLEASRRCGPLSMINALLRISDRVEINSDVTLRALLFAAEHPHPLAFSLVKDCVDALPRREVRSSELTTLMSSILPDKQRELEKNPMKGSLFRRWLGRRLLWLGSVLTQHRLARYRNQSYWQKIDWHCFDTVRVDGVLDENELPAFVRELGRNPMSGVRLTPDEQEAVSRPTPNPYRHPSTRTRILFLDKASTELAWRTAGLQYDGFRARTYG